MDLMLNLISTTPKISVFIVQVSLRRPNAEGTVIIYNVIVEEKLKSNLETRVPSHIYNV